MYILKIPPFNLCFVSNWIHSATLLQTTYINYVYFILLDLPLYTGQLVTVSRWQVRGGGGLLAVLPPGTGTPDRRRVAFADTSTADPMDVGRQLTGLEQEMAGLVRLRHPNILAYIGLVRQATQASF